jgi:hypothetical protein
MLQPILVFPSQSLNFAKLQFQLDSLVQMANRIVPSASAVKGRSEGIEET